MTEEQIQEKVMEMFVRLVLALERAAAAYERQVFINYETHQIMVEKSK